MREGMDENLHVDRLCVCTLCVCFVVPYKTAYTVTNQMGICVIVLGHFRLKSTIL